MKDKRDGELISPYTEEELARIMDGFEDYNRNVQEWLDILMTSDERAESDLGPSPKAETWRDRPPLL